ncbi:helix-turn-helix domain-containing protein [Dyadobacter koreensis]|uniref:helix-turn-helix domain-containing protein n=1 Tax=Dyadobacter koreensis TaxID=408657 RepID=UPI000B154E95|nr:helix-turn-helix domain-containing protein [Dyadobacter koreensis]
MLFTAPGELIGGTADEQDHWDCILLIEPDFFLNHPEAEKTRGYGFFSYTATEALHLSQKEKTVVLSVFQMIEQELNSRIDEFSRDIMVTQIELLLNYCVRFYKRQFIIRDNNSSDLLQRMDHVLDEYFNNDHALKAGAPTVQHLSDHLNFSPGYLRDMLSCLTGKSAQQHIHNRIIDRAMEKLSTTNLSIIAIAYELGFENPPSVSTLFKMKTQLSPPGFGHTFN